MALLAALDLGTNSFHLVVARVSPEGAIEVVTRHKETVRLGHGGGDMKVLEPEAIERGIAALHRARRLAESAGAPIRAVATSAVREAENAAEFIERARDEAGVEVEVISGVEEARLIHLGALRAVPVHDRRRLVCDIGGGSTEVLIGEHEEMLTARSFKLGAVRLTDRFFPGGEVTPGSVKKCSAHIRSALAVFEREVAQLGFEVAIGCSGSIEAVAKVAHAARATTLEPLRTYNCFEFTTDELDAVVDRLVAARTPAARKEIPGLEPERADIIVAGALILQGVAAAFGVERWTISENALREGVLIDTLARTSGGVSHPLGELARRGVDHLVELCDEDPQHSAHVAALAVRLFDELQPITGLGAAERDYLEAAARLANVGLFVAHSRHHLHSYYVIRNSELLTGLTDHEIELIALVARYHRKSAPKPTHPEFARLAPADQVLVRSLAGIVRVAIGLDRSHDGRVRDLRTTIAKKTVTITAVTAEPTDLSLELYAAMERRDLLEDVLGRSVTIRQSD